LLNPVPAFTLITTDAIPGAKIETVMFFIHKIIVVTDVSLILLIIIENAFLTLPHGPALFLTGVLKLVRLTSTQ